MRIIINTSKLRFGGAIQVALSFINECRNYGDHEYHIFVGQGVGRSLQKDDFPDNFVFYDFDFGILNLFKLRKISSKLSKFEEGIKPDCVVTTSGPSYWQTKAPHLMGFNLGMYIYNDSPFFKTISLYRKSRYALKRRIHFSLFKREASAYIVQTDDVNQRVRKALKTQDVFTVTNTHSGYFNGNTRYELDVPSKNEGEIWLLTLSSYYRHKNIEIIPTVLRELKTKGYNNVRFLLTLKDSTFETIFKGQDTRNIINVGPVRPEECPTLYAKCDFMFLPSLAECFSASYPEAMVMKKPIITTDLSFARSICDDAAVYYKPMDGKDAADKIDSVINDEQLRGVLVENGLHRLKHFDTAKERAGKILDICEKLITIS